ncbi:hypothetical protein [Streptomyces albospinus]|uniref:hypothetical protein n=1 Tax=Streptomyces albospinus TaxID=285515 RepID=UPI001670B3A9
MSCDSPHDYSPGLTITNAPAGTAELALFMVDVQDQKIHWLQVGIPAATHRRGWKRPGLRLVPA